MPIAFDAVTAGDGSSGTLNVSHTPIGTPRGIIALLKYDTLNEGVTYGGVAMELVGSNALSGPAGQQLSIWFLGSGIPTGTQALFSNDNTSTRVTIISLTADTDLEVKNFADISTVASGDITDTFDAGAEDAFIAQLWASSAAQTGTTSPLAGWIDAEETDEGASTNGAYRLGLSSGLTTFGVNSSNSQTVAVRAVAVGEVAAGYQPQGVNFDGVSAYLNRAADLTGNADSKKFTLSFWVRFTNVSAANRENIWRSQIAGDSGSSFLVERNTDERIRIFGRSPTNTSVLWAQTTAISDTTWHHVLVSVDLSSASLRSIYVDDSSDASFITYVDSEIDFTMPEHYVAAINTFLPAASFPGDLADFWFAPGVYIDFSVEANRRKFIGPNAATSVDLGEDGSTPTGSAPLVFFSGPTADWHTNKGTGGGFTENGALTDASTNPPAAVPPVEDQVHTITVTANFTFTAEVPQFINTGDPNYVPGAAHFSTTTRMQVENDIGDYADAKSFTQFFWIKTLEPTFTLIGSSGGGLRVTLQEVLGVRRVQFTARATSEQGLMLVAHFDADVSDGEWHSVILSCDIEGADPNKLHALVDGIPQTVVITTLLDTYDIQFSSGDFGPLIATTSQRGQSICLSQFFFASGKYADFSNPANNLLFLNPQNGYRDLGANGELPFNALPDLYFDGDASVWPINRGKAPVSYTMLGTLQNCATIPPLEPGNIIHPITATKEFTFGLNLPNVAQDHIHQLISKAFTFTANELTHIVDFAHQLQTLEFDFQSHAIEHIRDEAHTLLTQNFQYALNLPAFAQDHVHQLLTVDYTFTTDPSVQHAIDFVHFLETINFNFATALPTHTVEHVHTILTELNYIFGLGLPEHSVEHEHLLPQLAYHFGLNLPQFSQDQIHRPDTLAFTQALQLPEHFVAHIHELLQLDYQFELNLPIHLGTRSIQHSILELDLTPPRNADADLARWLINNMTILQQVFRGGVSGEFETSDGRILIIRNGIVETIYVP